MSHQTLDSLKSLYVTVQGKVSKTSVVLDALIILSILVETGAVSDEYMGKITMAVSVLGRYLRVKYGSSGDFLKKEGVTDEV